MSYRKNRPHPQTKELESGTVLEVAKADEPVTRLTLEDGTLVRLKISVVEIMRMDKPDKNGKPLFEVNANLTATFVPPEDQLND